MGHPQLWWHSEKRLGHPSTNKLIFRNMFIRQEDAKIAKVLWNYFTAVSQRWPIAWNQKQRGLILNRTTGYRALMQFLPIVILSLDLIDQVPGGVSICRGVRQRQADGRRTEHLRSSSQGKWTEAKLRNSLELQTRLTGRDRVARRQKTAGPGPQVPPVN